MKTCTLFLLALLIAAGCRTKGPSFDPLAALGPVESDGTFATANLTNRIDPSLLAPPTEPFRLGPGDVLEIEVIGEAKSQSIVTVGPDGKIYYSLLPGTCRESVSLGAKVGRGA